MFQGLRMYTIYDKDGKVIIHTKDENLAFKLFDEKKKHYVQISYDDVFDNLIIDSNEFHIV